MPKYNLNKIIARTGEKLEAAGIDAGAAEAEIILCDLLDFDRLHLYLHGPSIIDDDIMNRFEEIIEKRLTRYPLQYILGSAWFFGRKFCVDEKVMVPTPETELLLDSILRAARNLKVDPVKLLDIGVGSGVVALSAKLENPALDVTALDISNEALEVARLNARRFEIEDKITFVESDLFQEFSADQKFDIIASNPPYIADHEYEDLPPEVKADPSLALLAGPRGLDIIQRLIKRAPQFLNRPGLLMFEIGYNQADEVAELIKEDSHYDRFDLFKDLSDIDRVVICHVD